eukprot:1612889-Rhodomonas_salina.1
MALPAKERERAKERYSYSYAPTAAAVRAYYHYAALLVLSYPYPRTRTAITSSYFPTRSPAPVLQLLGTLLCVSCTRIPLLPTSDHFIPPAQSPRKLPPTPPAQ